MWNVFGPMFIAREGVETRMAPAPRGAVEILRRNRRSVTVRENRNGSLRYSVDGSRELTALQMFNRFRHLGI